MPVAVSVIIVELGNVNVLGFLLVEGMLAPATLAVAAIHRHKVLQDRHVLKDEAKELGFGV